MPQRVYLNLTIDLGALDSRPSLATQIAKITSFWAVAEQELGAIYGIALRTLPVLALSALGRVNSLPARLEMIQTALKLSTPPAYAAEFSKTLKEEIRKCSSLRNDVAHCQWTIHAEYPNHLIRCLGLSDPELTAYAYTEQDFQESQPRLLKLNLALRQFAEKLVSDPALAAHKVGGWQVHTPNPDKPESRVFRAAPPSGKRPKATRPKARLSNRPVGRKNGAQ